MNNLFLVGILVISTSLASALVGGIAFAVNATSGESGETLTLVVDANYNLPTGYGSIWTCQVRSVVTGVLADEIVMLSVCPWGDPYDGYFQTFESLEDYETLEISFERLDERPAALSGFTAADGTIWEIALVRSAKYKLPWAFEGRYEVSWVTEVTADVIAKAGVGELTLRDGDYEFYYTANRLLPEDALSRLPFLVDFKGEYTIEYYGDTNDGDVLKGLGDHDILATVTFWDSEGEYAAAEFFIRNNAVNRELYFGSTVSEFELWAIKKGWEE